MKITYMYKSQRVVLFVKLERVFKAMAALLSNEKIKILNVQGV